MLAHWITESIGSTAGFCTCISLIPQLHGIWRSKSARDLSLGMFLIFGLGVLLWLTYGIEIRSAPVIVANAATLALVIAILALKLRYDGKEGNKGLKD
jgi:MtN3 and saliva related transmembrane protein